MIVRAIHPIKHDGKRYAPGKTFEVSARVAEALRDAGLVVIEEKPKKPSSKKR